MQPLLNLIKEPIVVKLTDIFRSTGERMPLAAVVFLALTGSYDSE